MCSFRQVAGCPIIECFVLLSRTPRQMQGWRQFFKFQLLPLNLRSQHKNDTRFAYWRKVLPSMRSACFDKLFRFTVFQTQVYEGQNLGFKHARMEMEKRGSEFDEKMIILGGVGCPHVTSPGYPPELDDHQEDPHQPKGGLP